MKTYIVTPSFCRGALLTQCMEHLYGNDSFLGFFRIAHEIEHIIIDNHYPMGREENLETYLNLAKKYSLTYVDCKKDLGLHHGINYALKEVGIKKESIVIGCDPDDRPSPGTFAAMTEVMTADPTLAVLGASFNIIYQRVKLMKEELIAGKRVWIHPTVEMWNIAAYNYSFIESIGGFGQPYAYYGGIEGFLYHRWIDKKLRLGYLIDYNSEGAPVNKFDPAYFDPQYRKWKEAHLGGFKGSFAEWLQLNPHL